MFNLWQALFFSSEDEAVYNTGHIPEIKHEECWYRVRVKITQEEYEPNSISLALNPQISRVQDVYRVTTSKVVKGEDDKEHEFDPHATVSFRIKEACEQFLTDWHIPIDEEYWSAVENWSMGREE
jgi:hypothetical protein